MVKNRRVVRGLGRGGVQSLPPSGGAMQIDCSTAAEPYSDSMMTR